MSHTLNLVIQPIFIEHLLCFGWWAYSDKTDQVLPGEYFLAGETDRNRHKIISESVINATKKIKPRKVTE